MVWLYCKREWFGSNTCKYFYSPGSIDPGSIITQFQAISSNGKFHVEVACHRLETVSWWNDQAGGAPLCRIYFTRPSSNGIPLHHLDGNSPEAIANITLQSRLNEVPDNICQSIYRD